MHSCTGLSSKPNEERLIENRNLEDYDDYN